tara:strand:- start:485 stop:730 length:246 start_codon:yes stop_codon:yes gene_type:complete
MVKYKNLKPEIIQEFIDKIFTSVVTNTANKTIKDLAKKDKQFAKNYDALKKLRAKVEKDLKAKGMTTRDSADDIKRKLRDL